MRGKVVNQRNQKREGDHDEQCNDRMTYEKGFLVNGILTVWAIDKRAFKTRFTGWTDWHHSIITFFAKFRKVQCAMPVKQDARWFVPFSLYLLRMVMVPLFFWSGSEPKIWRFAVGDALLHGGMYIVAPLFLMGLRSSKLLLFPALIAVGQWAARLVDMKFFALFGLIWWLLWRTLSPYPYQRRFFGFRKTGVHFLFLAVAFWLLLISHIFLLAHFAGISMATEAFAQALPWWFHAASVNALAEELFFRGYFFQMFYRGTGHFFAAAMLTSFLYALHYLLSQTLVQDPVVSVAAVFYTFAFGMFSCLLFSGAQSLWPSLVLSFLFHGSLNSLRW